jgi:hypothetical protein
MASDDPARKYLPKEGRTSSSGSNASVLSDVDHGTFTNIAYATAWAVAIIGTIAGLLMVAQAFEGRGGPDFTGAIFGVLIIASAWVSASGVGTLAEISRKLTKKQ